ncbi:hypothetical protein, partial [Vibrio vulnificus]|uniref:hypothetical protein n=1 Tax=Vibrio vulnificus TaxID=672 RepID=UPI0019D45722
CTVETTSASSTSVGGEESTKVAESSLSNLKLDEEKFDNREKDQISSENTWVRVKEHPIK